jgi:hypothetical protein
LEIVGLKEGFDPIVQLLVAATGFFQICLPLDGGSFQDLVEYLLF